ncbi:MAG: ATP-dependent DNA helicase [Opitutales bacterium]
MIHFIESTDLPEDGLSEESLLAPVQKIFSENGDLVNHLGFEFRPEQALMATTFSKSLINGKHLIFEAGTGVGKSLAYLIPSLIFSVFTKRKCVVATNTINLQEQLLSKDIPTIRELFNRSVGLEGFREFNCALLVGRANYLCTNRLHRALLSKSDLFEASQYQELQRIADWVASGPIEGIRQELSPSPNPLVWDMVNADSSLCSSQRCSPKDCYYRKARALVDHADLVILNHSLLFSLLGAGVSSSNEGSGILFPDDFLVFDEAHEITEVASEHLGVSLSSWALETLMRQLYNPKKRKGLLSRLAREVDLVALDHSVDAIRDFFQYLHLDILDQKDRVRLNKSTSLPMEIFPPLSRLLRNLIELSEVAKDETLKIELRDKIKRLQGYLSDLAEVIDQKKPDSVYWLERGGRSNQIIYLRSAPLEIAPILKEEVFSKDSSVLMTSATITRKGSADYFRKEVGADFAEECLVRSPFDYENQMTIKICNDCPEPQMADRNRYLEYLTRAIGGLAQSVEGGTLVLFTNYSDLRYCHEQLRPQWSRLQRSIYAQGGPHSRSELRKRVVEEGDALLLGAESFWKGFDAKGSCISQVIITRLPFENPGHPLLEAKSEILQAKKLSSFREITLPSAVIRFRQGVGRLIRSSTDCGFLIILDSRILNKNYGKEFIADLPHSDFESTCLLDLLGC